VAGEDSAECSSYLTAAAIRARELPHLGEVLRTRAGQPYVGVAGKLRLGDRGNIERLLREFSRSVRLASRACDPREHH
jgi:hypothetical protein